MSALPNKLSLHVHQSQGRIEAHTEIPATPARNYAGISLGDGEKIICTIDANDWESPYVAGYPQPTIAEAKAIADEMIRRWNAHEELVEAIHEIRNHHEVSFGDYWNNEKALRTDDIHEICDKALAKAEGRA